MHTIGKEKFNIGSAFAVNLQNYRKINGMSMNKLAKIAGVSTSYIARLESQDKCNPSFLLILRLAKILNVDQQKLVGIEQRSSKMFNEVVDELVRNIYHLENYELSEYSMSKLQDIMMLCYQLIKCRIIISGDFCDVIQKMNRIFEKEIERVDKQNELEMYN